MPVEEEYEDVEELVDDEDDEREEEEEDVRPPKMHLMGDSGQTEEERRQLRRKQRQLHKDMEESGESLDVDEVRVFFDVVGLLLRTLHSFLTDALSFCAFLFR